MYGGGGNGRGFPGPGGNGRGFPGPGRGTGRGYLEPGGNRPPRGGRNYDDRFHPYSRGPRGGSFGGQSGNGSSYGRNEFEGHQPGSAGDFGGHYSPLRGHQGNFRGRGAFGEEVYSFQEQPRRYENSNRNSDYGGPETHFDSQIPPQNPAFSQYSSRNFEDSSPHPAFREQNYSTPGSNRGSLRGGHGSAAPSASGYHNQHNLEYRQGEYNDRGNFRGRGGQSAASPYYSSRGPSDSTYVDNENKTEPFGQDYYSSQGSYNRGSPRGRGGHYSNLPNQPQSSDFESKYQPSSVPAKTDMMSRGYLNANFQPNLTNEDDEPSYDDSKVKLDWYNSDLNLKIDPMNLCSAQAMSEKGFAHLWAGVRATYGVTYGKASFEVTITNNQNTDHLENEPNPHVLRVGWSIDFSSLALGTEMYSYGYGGTGKASTNNRFFNYGQRYGLGDVVGCFLDMTGETILIGYTLNGNDLGPAFRVPRSTLGGQALFPHIMTKNQDFLVNFGQMNGPMKPLLPYFSIIGRLDKQNLVRATQGSKNKKDCLMYTMVGLPGAGKTTWAKELLLKNPDKKFNILGTNALLDGMKVMGLTRKGNYHGRWEALISKCTECFNILIEIAKKKKRNYILDQTNVFPSARVRKMKEFGDFTQKIVVVVPNDDEYQRRLTKRTQEEGVNIPPEAILSMKANFVLPDIEEANQGTTTISYTDLEPMEAEKIIKRYNQEASEAGHQMKDVVKKYIHRNENKRQMAGAQNLPGKLWTPEESTSTNVSINNMPTPSSSSSTSNSLPQFNQASRDTFQQPQRYYQRPY